jgi:hypothetical protein
MTREGRKEGRKEGKKEARKEGSKEGTVSFTFNVQLGLWILICMKNLMYATEHMCFNAVVNFIVLRKTNIVLSFRSSEY